MTVLLHVHFADELTHNREMQPLIFFVLAIFLPCMYFYMFGRISIIKVLLHISLYVV